MERKRVETGSVQFEQDWPGVFIRGDEAAYFAMSLRPIVEELVEKAKDGSLEFLIRSKTLAGLLELLEHSNIHNNQGKDVQLIERK